MQLKKPQENNVDLILAEPADETFWQKFRDESWKSGLLITTSITKPDPHFAEAHAIGEELRNQRREGREVCCGKYASRFHRCDDPSAESADEYDAYYASLSTASQPVRIKYSAKFSEWREIPNSEYEMHSITREVYRRDYDKVLPSGKTRHYKRKIVNPSNGSYSLRIDGKTVPYGVDALYQYIFPDVDKKKVDGEWDDTIIPRGADTHAEKAWMAEGNSHLIDKQIPL